MDDLTNLERRILALLAQGMTNPQIASALGVKPQTVANRTPMIYRKINVQNRTQAAIAWKQQETAYDNRQ